MNVKGTNMALREESVPFLAQLVRRADSSRSTKDVSILTLAAASFGSRHDPDSTVPTGFDPAAVALFEGLVECAFLVAHADGVFDEQEREAFERLVVVACEGAVAPKQIASLVADLEAQREEDGEDARIRAAAAAFKRPYHAEEALRVAVVMARASEDVSEVERRTIGKIAEACGLPPSAVDDAFRVVDAEIARA
jgi:tellurite resistance protein